VDVQMHCFSNDGATSAKTVLSHMRVPEAGEDAVVKLFIAANVVIVPPFESVRRP
jgi:hypothetical protein